MKITKYFETLMEKVIELSEANNWEDAVKEWEIFDCDENKKCSSVCVCGKENIKYLFTIINKHNKNKLFPIGSSCIKKFGREDLKEETSIYESILKLKQIKNKSTDNNYEYIIQMINKKSNINEDQKKKIQNKISNTIIQSPKKGRYPKWYKGAGRW